MPPQAPVNPFSSFSPEDQLDIHDQLVALYGSDKLNPAQKQGVGHALQHLANAQGLPPTAVEPQEMAFMPQTAQERQLSAPRPGTELEHAGELVPNAAAPALGFATHSIIDPFNQRIAQAGQTTGSIAEHLVTGIPEAPTGSDASPSDLAWRRAHGIPAITPQDEQDRLALARIDRPILTGASRAVGSLIGETAADPRQWPLLFAGGDAVEPVFAKLMSGGFGIQMSADAVANVQDLHANWDKLTPDQRAERITSAGITTAFAAGSAAHVLSGGHPEVTPENTPKSVTADGLSTASSATASIRDKVAPANASIGSPDASQPAAGSDQRVTPTQADAREMTPRKPMQIPVPKEILGAPTAKPRTPGEPLQLGFDPTPAEDLGNAARQATEVTQGALPRGERRVQPRTPDEIKTQTMFAQARQELGEDASSDEVMDRVVQLLTKEPSKTLPVAPPAAPAPAADPFAELQAKANKTLAADRQAQDMAKQELGTTAHPDFLRRAQEIKQQLLAGEAPTVNAKPAMRLDATLAPPKPEAEPVARRAPKVEPEPRSAPPIKPSSLPEGDVARHEAQLAELDSLIKGQPDAAVLRETRRKVLDKAGALQERKAQIKDQLADIRTEGGNDELAKALRAEHKGINNQVKRLADLYTRSSAALGETPSKQYRIADSTRIGIENNSRLTPEARAEAHRKLDARVAEARDAIRKELGQSKDPARRRQLLKLVEKDVVVAPGKGIKPNAGLNAETGAWEIRTPEQYIDEQGQAKTRAGHVFAPEISLKVVRRLNKEIGDGRYVQDLISLVPPAERDQVTALKGTDPVAYHEAVKKAATNWLANLRNQVQGRLDAARTRVERDRRVVEPSSGRMEAPEVGTARQIIRDLKTGNKKLSDLSDADLKNILSKPGVATQELGPAVNKPSNFAGQQVFSPRENLAQRFLDRIKQEQINRQRPTVEGQIVSPEAKGKPETHAMPEKAKRTRQDIEREISELSEKQGELFEDVGRDPRKLEAAHVAFDAIEDYIGNLIKEAHSLPRDIPSAMNLPSIAQRLMAKWNLGSLTPEQAQHIVETTVPQELLKAMKSFGPVIGVTKTEAVHEGQRFYGLFARDLSDLPVQQQMQAFERGAKDQTGNTFFLQARKKVQTWLTNFSMRSTAAHELGHAVFSRIDPKDHFNAGKFYPEAAREILDRYQASGVDLGLDPPRALHEMFAHAFMSWYNGEGTTETRLAFAKQILDNLRDPKVRRTVMQLMLEGKMLEGAPETSLKDLKQHIDDFQAINGKDSPYALPSFGRGKPQAPAVNPELQKIQDAREAAQGRPRFLDRLRRLPINLVRDYYEQFVYIPGGSGASRFARVDGVNLSKSAIEARTGKPLDLSENPFVEMRLAYGGGTGLVQETGLRLADLANEMEDKGLHNNFIEALDLAAYKHAWTTIEEKYTKAHQDIQKHTADVQQIASDIQSGKRTVINAADDLKSARYNLTKAKAAKKQFGEAMISRKVVPEGLTPADIASAEANMQKTLGPQKWQQIQDARQKVFDITREGLNSLHNEGLIDHDLYIKLAQRGDYLPIHRMVAERMQEANTLWGGRNSSLDMRASKVIQKLEGSDKVNVNPLHDVLSTMEDIHVEVQRNQAARKLIEFTSKDPQGFGSLVRPLGAAEEPREGFGAIGYYKDGVPQRFEVPAEISETVRMAHPDEMDMVNGTILKTARKIFQYGTTLANLDFAVPNVIRDLQDRQALSKGNHTAVQIFTQAIGEWGSAFKDVLAKNDKYREFLKSRAAFSTFQKRLVPEDFLQDHRLGITGKLVRGKVIGAIEDINNAFEEATKLSTYKRLRSKGMSVDEAAWETRNYGGSPDFGARGAKSPTMNLLLMFFNANVRGVGRTFGRFAEDPKRLGWLLAGATLAAMIQHRHNSQFTDEEGQPEEKHVSNVDKENYFHLLRPEVYQTSQGSIRHQMFNVPKGHVAKLIFNPIEQTIDQTMRQHKFDGGQTALNFLSTILPGQADLHKGTVVQDLARGVLSSTNPIIREPLEQALNYDSFRGVPIVSKGMENIDPQEKYVPTTPLAARHIAAVTNRVPGLHDIPLVGPAVTEPKRIEHMVEGFTGGLGKRALDIYDLGAKAAGQGPSQTMPLEGDENIGKYPIASRFVGKIQDQEEKDLSEKFYTAAAQAQQVQQTFARFKRQDPSQAQLYLNDPNNAKQIALARVYGDVEKKLSKMRNVEILIRNDKDLSVDDKKQQMHALYNARIQVLRAIVNNVTNQ